MSCGGASWIRRQGVNSRLANSSLELKEELNKVIEQHSNWLNNNQMASKEEYDSKKVEFDNAMKPLQEKMMSNMSNMSNMSKEKSSNENDVEKELNIEDVD